MSLAFPLFFLWLSGIAALLVLATIAWKLAPLYPAVVALGFAFSPRTFAAIVHEWSPEQLALYRAALHANFLFLACYAAFGFFLARRCKLFVRYSRGLRLIMAAALPLAGSLGAVATALHLWLTEMPRFGVPLPYAVSAACVTAEALILLAFGLAVIHGLAREDLQE